MAETATAAVPAPAAVPAARPAVARWLWLGLASIAGWLAVAGTMLLALVSDALRQGRTPDPARAIGATLPYFIPLMLGTWVMAVVFLRRADDDEPPPAWRLVWPVLLVFVPVNAGWAALVSMWRQGRPPSAYLELLAAQGLYNLWIDTVIALGAFAAVAAWSARRRRQAADRRGRALESANQRLRLQLLQAQLEPHFLFNTLNGVSALVRAGERADALTALAEVSALLRHALRGSRVARVPWADELAFVRAYLRLQQLRFGDGLRLELAIDEDTLAGLACPPLLLQPLVENAVRHGVEAAGGVGRVALHIDAGDEAGGTVRVVVENPVAPPDAEGGHGLGLAATRERLSLLFGDRARLDAGVDGGRFRVRLEMPRELQDDDGEASA